MCDCGGVEGGVEDEEGFWLCAGGGRGCEDLKWWGGGHCLSCVMAVMVGYMYCIVEGSRG